MGIQKSEAILFSTRDIRETSSIVIFYTKDFGKIKGLIKGIRGPQAKLGVFLSDFGKYDIVFYEKPKSDTCMITQCDLKDSYPEISDSFEKRIKAYYIVELIDKFTPFEEKSAELYSLFNWILDFIRKEKFIGKAVILFQLKLLELAGFLPQLDICVNCSGKLPKDAHFSVRLSGLLCHTCRGVDIQTILLSKGAAATIDMIRKQKIGQLGRSNITNEIAKELNALLDKFILYHLGEHLKTTDFMRQL